MKTQYTLLSFFLFFIGLSSIKGISNADNNKMFFEQKAVQLSMHYPASLNSNNIIHFGAIYYPNIKALVNNNHSNADLYFNTNYNSSLYWLKLKNYQKTKPSHFISNNNIPEIKNDYFFGIVLLKLAAGMNFFSPAKKIIENKIINKNAEDFNISKNKTLPDPGVITSSGTTYICSGQSRTYSITAITGATNYTWTVPAGATINSGQGSTSISVTFGANAGSICVSANNSCETTNATCLSIEIENIPLDATSISGNASPYPGQQSINYYITSVFGATSYNWTYSGSGFSIASGAGTSSITVNYSCSASAGVLTVKSVGTCGTSPGTNLSIAPKPAITASAGANQSSSICTSTITIGGNPTAANGTGTYTYSWSPGTGLSSTSVANPTTAASSNTTYTVTVTDGNSCSATSSMTFTAGYVGSTVTFNNTSTGQSGTMQSWTVPSGVTCAIIEVWGAEGGSGNKSYSASNQLGGKGARMKGNFSVTPGQVLKILVGQRGSHGDGGCGSTDAGGGGGSFVTDASNNPIIIAGGGGGGMYYGGNYNGTNHNGQITNDGGRSYNCASTASGGNGGPNCNASYGAAGGGGLTGTASSISQEGVTGGQSFVSGGTGGNGGNVYSTRPNGGYGGGGGGSHGCCRGSGGGGGYSGGTGDSNCGAGGGGGSYNNGTNQSNLWCFQTGHGNVLITY